MFLGQSYRVRDSIADVGMLSIDREFPARVRDGG